MQDPRPKCCQEFPDALPQRQDLKLQFRKYPAIHMKENKSPGVDVISPKILKEIVEQISMPLAHVFNMSLQEGIVPLEWKEANIIPLFKKGSRNKSVNYRPVSLTSVICKLLETIIRDHMMDFLLKHRLTNHFQHGFLKANLLCFLRK